MESARLREFLGEGTIIRTKHCSSSTWVTNVIYAINEDYIEIDIGLEKDYIDNMIMIGDTMKCKYTTEQHEITLIGWVTRIKADFPQSITIKVHDIEKFANKRDSYRYDVYLCSIIKVKHFEEKGIFAILTNISRTGAAFVIKEDIEKQLGLSDSAKVQNVCVFEVYVSPDKLIVFEGTIQRKCDNERGKEYGVKITDIDLKSEKVLSELLEELEKKDKEFYNKRSGFWSKHSKYINDGEK